MIGMVLSEAEEEVRRKLHSLCSASQVGVSDIIYSAWTRRNIPLVRSMHNPSRQYHPPGAMKDFVAAQTSWPNRQ